MDAVIHRIMAWDGLPLVAHEWDAGDTGTPLLCLPGLVRTGEDFYELAQLVGAGRRVVAPDYAGRGASGRSTDVTRYSPEACLRDVLDLCAALHLHAIVAIGTSFGGLLAMGIGAARPTLLRGVVLNDIGPEVGTAGGDFVRRFVADDPALADLDACVAHLRARLRNLSLETDAAWRRMAGLTYAKGADGRFHPTWDTAIAKLLGARPPPLWPLFGGLAHIPVLLAWGEVSNILLPETVAAMRAARPDMAVVSLPGIGHVPTLTELSVLNALTVFLQRIDLERSARERSAVERAFPQSPTLQNPARQNLTFQNPDLQAAP
jgi:pimeloyl-ACP methyl ester carboxylesterase